MSEQSLFDKLRPDYVSVPKETLDAAIRAMAGAREAIQACHGLPGWKIYEKNAPEMRRLDAALSSLRSLSEGVKE